MNAQIGPMAALTDLLFGQAWNRVLPDAVIAVLPPLLMEGPMTREDLDALLRQDSHSVDGLASDAWEPLHAWTDLELTELDEHFEDTPLAATHQRTAEEVIAEDLANRARNLGDMERYFKHCGLAVDHSIGGMVELMVACRILTSDGEGRLTVNGSAPLPGEVLPLDPQERAAQDDLRWERLHQGVAQAVIDLFAPEEQVTVRLRTSIADLAQRLERAPESIRSGLSILISEGDFIASSNLDTVEQDQDFDLRVDWKRFNETRMGIRFATDT